MVHRVPGPIDVRKVQSSPSALQFVSSTAISAAATGNCFLNCMG